ncbi:MAG: hypothetical protein KC620_10645 [Myxococcales bacterium]|nr:hypothetical protein [Myxococcales bacterium]
MRFAVRVIGCVLVGLVGAAVVAGCLPDLYDDCADDLDCPEALSCVGGICTRGDELRSGDATPGDRGLDVGLDAGHDHAMPDARGNRDAVVDAALPAELCNAADDDGDGRIDEAAVCPRLPFATSVCTAGDCAYACLGDNFDANDDLSDGCQRGCVALAAPRTLATGLPLEAQQVALAIAPGQDRTAIVYRDQAAGATRGLVVIARDAEHFAAPVSIPPQDAVLGAPSVAVEGERVVVAARHVVADVPSGYRLAVVLGERVATALFSARQAANGLGAPGVATRVEGDLPIAAVLGDIATGNQRVKVASGLARLDGLVPEQTLTISGGGQAMSDVAPVVMATAEGFVLVRAGTEGVDSALFARALAAGLDTASDSTRVLPGPALGRLTGAPADDGARVAARTDARLVVAALDASGTFTGVPQELALPDPSVSDLRLVMAARGPIFVFQTAEGLEIGWLDREGADAEWVRQAIDRTVITFDAAADAGTVDIAWLAPGEGGADLRFARFVCH